MLTSYSFDKECKLFFICIYVMFWSLIVFIIVVVVVFFYFVLV